MPMPNIAQKRAGSHLDCALFLSISLNGLTLAWAWAWACNGVPQWCHPRLGLGLLSPHHPGSALALHLPWVAACKFSTPAQYIFTFPPAVVDILPTRLLPNWARRASELGTDGARARLEGRQGNRWSRDVCMYVCMQRQGNRWSRDVCMYVCMQRQGNRWSREL